MANNDVIRFGYSEIKYVSDPAVELFMGLLISTVMERTLTNQELEELCDGVPDSWSKICEHHENYPLLSSTEQHVLKTLVDQLISQFRYIYQDRQQWDV